MDTHHKLSQLRLVGYSCPCQPECNFVPDSGEHASCRWSEPGSFCFSHLEHIHPRRIWREHFNDIICKMCFLRSRGRSKTLCSWLDNVTNPTTATKTVLLFFLMCSQFLYAQMPGAGLSSSRTDQMQQIEWEGEVCQQLQMDWYQRKQKISKDQTPARDHGKSLTPPPQAGQSSKSIIQHSYK